MLIQVLIFIISILLVIEGASLATKYSLKLTKYFKISRHVVSFVIVAFVGIFPETIISINSALQGIPEFGLGTLFGVNVAILTLIFALLVIFSDKGIVIENKLLKNVRLYPFFILLPVIFGLDGFYSRTDGIVLIISGILFYFLIFNNSANYQPPIETTKETGKSYKNILFLLFSIALLILGAHFTVNSATKIAHFLEISPILIGLFVVGLGATLPEFSYSFKAIKKKEHSLAVGDLMGTVLSNATLVVGMLALINPFYFPVKIIYISGTIMFIASLVLLNFMRSGKIISKKEGILLLFFWIAYALIEIFTSWFLNV